jgi:5-methylcytosine-specific restriction endonuclease McrA
MVFKRTPLPCIPDNCGNLFPKCGKIWTYSQLGCRCDSCHAIKKASWQKYPKRVVPPPAGPCSAENCGELFSKCGAGDPYREQRCRCDACLAARAEVKSAKAVARAKQWAKDNRERDLANHRLSKRRCYDERKEYNRDWRRANHDRLRDALRERRRANPEAHREYVKMRRALKINSTVVKFTTDQWEQKCAYWGNRCYLQIPGLCTGGADTQDHVKPLKAVGGSAHMLANLRPACAPCNASKNNKWPYAVPAGPGF